MMQTIRVSPANIKPFVTYCQRFAKEHDDSYLPDESFDPGEDYPAYLLLNNSDVIGAACLIKNKQFQAAKKGRFMIFHSTQLSLAAYRQLLDAILPHAVGLDSIYLFIPEQRETTRAILQQMSFSIERYSYLLEYAGVSPTANLPQNLCFHSLMENDSERIAQFTQLLNLNFASSKGHVEILPSQISDLFDDSVYIPQGLKLMCDGAVPIGTVHVCKDDEDNTAAFVEMLSIHPDYRNRGLGRTVLRESIRFALANGFQTIYLTVNAENESAIHLYISEGFVKANVIICYSKTMQF